MHYFEFDPAPHLAAYVSNYWGMSVSMQTPHGHQHHVLPDGCMSIACVRTPAGEMRASLVGPRTEPLTVIVNPGDRYWGVRFWPDTGRVVLRVEPRKLHGHLVAPLRDPPWLVAMVRELAACIDEKTAARLLDDHLALPVTSAAPLDPSVRAAVVALITTNGEMEIAEVARGVNLSLRQFERRFAAATGLTAKQLARIRRMRSALAHLLGTATRTWSEVAAEFGYADHSHLVRDFGRLAGLTPSQVSERVRAITHGRVRP